jgi:ribosome-associated protein
MSSEDGGAGLAGLAEIRFIHASGPGGQNVNKVATAAQLRYDLSRSPLDEAQLRRLRALAGRQVSRDGFLVITARDHRSQALNKAEALARLAALLARAQAPPPKPRKATRPSRRAVERRLAEKKRRGRNKAGRAAVTASGDD